MFPKNGRAVGPENEMNARQKLLNAIDELMSDLAGMEAFGAHTVFGGAHTGEGQQAQASPGV